MQFSRCTMADVTAAVAKANAEGDYSLYFDFTSASGRSFRGRILPASSHDKGARRAASGRRVKAACWHAHRDVMLALFDAVPEAKVSTALATYVGRQSFLEQYGATRSTNHGSMMAPASYGDLCDCEE